MAKAESPSLRHSLKTLTESVVEENCPTQALVHCDGIFSAIERRAWDLVIALTKPPKLRGGLVLEGKPRLNGISKKQARVNTNVETEVQFRSQEKLDQNHDAISCNTLALGDNALSSLSLSAELDIATAFCGDFSTGYPLSPDLSENYFSSCAREWLESFQ